MLFPSLRNQYFEEIELLDLLALEFQREYERHKNLFFIIPLVIRDDGKAKIEQVLIFADENHAFEIFHQKPYIAHPSIVTNKFRGVPKLLLIGMKSSGSRLVSPKEIKPFRPDRPSRIMETRELLKVMSSIEMFEAFFGIMEDLNKSR